MLNISNFPWAECSITENRIIYQNDSLSLKRKKRNTGVMRYEFELVTIDMDMAEGRSVKAKLSAAVDDTLLFIHPRLSYSLGDIPAGGLVNHGVALAGSKTVNIIAFNNLNPWSLKAGDYLQLSNDTKVYEVAEDTNDFSGSKTVKLTSEVRITTIDAEPVIVDGVTWHLESDGKIETSMEANDNQDIEVTLVAVEKL